MAFYVDKQLYFDFYLNGYSIPVTLADINSLAIVNNRFDLLPALRLDINDTKAIFSKGALSDGAIISIAVGNDEESALKNMMEFMYVSSPSESIKRSSDRYLIYGLYIHKFHLTYTIMLSFKRKVKSNNCHETDVIFTIAIILLQK